MQGVVWVSDERPVPSDKATVTLPDGLPLSFGQLRVATDLLAECHGDVRDAVRRLLAVKVDQRRSAEKRLIRLNCHDTDCAVACLHTVAQIVDVVLRHIR